MMMMMMMMMMMVVVALVLHTSDPSYFSFIMGREILRRNNLPAS
jgi:hypothetical protein